MAEVRLYLDQPLSQGQPAVLTQPQAHYLFAVMRLDVGAEIRIFDGRSGEWRAEVVEAGKRRGIVVPRERTKPFSGPPDLWLMFAPVKKARTDFIVEKAVEMGAARLMPVVTDHTSSERIRGDRMEVHVIEAAEQCGAVCLPELTDLQPLSKVLDRWPEGRRLMWADEGAAGAAALDGLAGAEPGAWAILIGPEGGFSGNERARLRALPFVTRVSLGPRILRADTAAVAALALWQAHLGDWR
jgi:16S rRNA (uracil1498-N3)-methyltransferase